jgi:hypothetical protein
LIGEIPEPLAPDLYGKVFFLNSLVFLESMWVNLFIYSRDLENVFELVKP